MIRFVFCKDALTVKKLDWYIINTGGRVVQSVVILIG